MFALKNAVHCRSDVLVRQSEALAQIIYRTYLAELVLYADHFDRSRVVLCQHLAHRRTKTVDHVVVLCRNDRAGFRRCSMTACSSSGFQVNIFSTRAEMPCSCRIFAALIASATQ